MKRHFTLVFLLLQGFAFTSFSQLKQITDFNSGPGFSNPGHFSPVNGEIYMHADDGRSGWEIWKTNGTAEGTTLVQDLNLGPNNSVVETNSTGKDIQFKNKLYYQADDGIHGKEIWSTNGATTEMITNDLGVVVSDMAVSKDHFYFLTYHWPMYKLWKCDGSKNGVTLVKDMYVSGESNYNDMHNITQAMGLIFFSIGDYGMPTTVWRTDGTDVGTFPVAEELQGIGQMSTTAGKYATQFIEFDSHLYFIAHSEQFGGQVGLVRTDGTIQGTQYIKAMFDLTGDGLEFWNAIVHDGKMYFSFYDEETNRNFIWTSEGTFGTTTQIYDYSAPQYFSPSVLCSSGSNLYFTSGLSTGGTALLHYNAGSGVQILKQLTTSTQRPVSFSRQLDFVNIEAGNPNEVYVNAIQPVGELSALWYSNGTADGTARLSDAHKRGGMLFRDGSLYYCGNEWELWKTNGTPLGTSLVKDINVADKGISFQSFRSFPVAVANKIIYAAYTPDHGSELRITGVSGTESTQVVDIFPGTQGSDMRDLVAVDNGAYFIASPRDQVMNIFFTDGTISGTVPAVEFSGALPINLYKARDNKLFIRAQVTGGGVLYLFEGGSLTEVKRLYEPGGTSNVFAGATVRNGRLYFMTTTGGSSWSLWKSDGTPTSTVKIKECYTMFTSVRNQTGTGPVYFAAKEQETDDDYRIYSSDGTSAGTVVIKTLPLSSYVSPNFYGLENRTVFLTAGADSMRKLWITSGTPESTILLNELEFLQNNGENMPEFTRLKDELFFCAKKDDLGYELWKTDGTAVGTVLVKDINPGADSSRPSSFAVVGDYLYFSAYTPEYGFEVWRTDGSAENTKLVVDVYPGAAYSNPWNFLSVAGKLGFVARSGLSGDQLFTYTPEDAITSVEDFSRSNLLVYPNPTDGPVRFEDERITGGTVDIYDTRGNCVMKNISLAEEMDIDLSKRPPGLYLLKFRKSGKILTAKILKL